MFLKAYLILLFLSFSFSSSSMDMKIIKRDILKNRFSQDRTYVINFWATWCKNCIQEIDFLNRFKKNNDSKKTLFIAVNAGEKQAKVDRFLSRYKFEFEIFMDPKKKVINALNIKELPMTIIIRRGRIVYQDSLPPRKL